MTNDVFYLFDCMHHLAQLLAMAPYTRKWSRETSRYEYSPHMNKTQYFTVAVLVVLMVLGSYMAIMEVQWGEETDSSAFDKIAFLYIYLEPTFSGTIVLCVFTYNAKCLIKSFRLLHKTHKTLEIHTMWLIKFRVWAFYTGFLVGNFLYNLHSYMNGKTPLHSLYEYLGWGISFHAQQMLLLYFVVHMEFAHMVASKLNDHLDTHQTMEKLAKIGTMHFELCKSVAYMNKLASPTILLFSIRSYFVLCCSLMSLNGMLPKLRVDFFILAFLYVSTTIQFVLINDSVHRTSQTTGKLLCESTVTFFHNDLGSKRNTLLLQMLHQTTKTAIYGVPLTTSTLTTGFGKILTLLSFLLQLRGWSSNRNF